MCPQGFVPEDPKVCPGRWAEIGSGRDIGSLSFLVFNRSAICYTLVTIRNMSYMHEEILTLAMHDSLQSED